MRVLYIHQYFSTRAGWNATRSYEFARRWVQAGHQVSMVTGLSDRSDLRSSEERVTRQVIDGIDVLSIKMSYSNYMSFPRRIIAFFSFMLWSTWVGMHYVGPVDVIFATSPPLTAGIPGYLLSLWKRAPLVFELRDLWPEAPIQLGALRNPLTITVARWLERFLYHVSRHIITLSPGTFDALVQMGVPQSKLSMIPNCSDLDVFQPRRPVPALVAKYQMGQRFVLTYSGAMGMANGLSAVVETARVLQERQEDGFYFFLVGDGSERPHLQSLVTKYQLRNLVLLPSMPKTELADFLTLSDVCLCIFASFPVLEMTSPNKFFDALSLGRPVLINYGGWMKDVLEQNQAGVAVPSNNSEEIADCIVALRSRPDWVAMMGRNARALAEREYDREKLSQKLEAALRSVAKSADKR